MKERTMFRQGDILFLWINETQAKDETTAIHNTIEIAQGEATGHHHVAVGEELSIMLSIDEVVDRLNAPKGCRIVHEEHNPLELPPGNYEVRRQREYVYGKDSQTAVED
jgi:hypothetical protein